VNGVPVLELVVLESCRGPFLASKSNSSTVVIGMIVALVISCTLRKDNGCDEIRKEFQACDLKV